MRMLDAGEEVNEGCKFLIRMKIIVLENIHEDFFS